MMGILQISVIKNPMKTITQMKQMTHHMLLQQQTRRVVWRPKILMEELVEAEVNRDLN